MTFEQWWEENYAAAFGNHELAAMGRAVREVAERAWNEKPGFNGPAKFTEEEIADNNRAVRWITADGVHGRPSDHDVREYLERTPQLTGCTCEKCKAFYGGEVALTDEQRNTIRRAMDLADESGRGQLAAKLAAMLTAHSFPAAESEKRDGLTDRQQHTVDCVNAWLKDAGLPAYSAPIDGEQADYVLVPRIMTDAMEGAFADAEAEHGTAQAMWQAAIRAAMSRERSDN